ncbi:MAG: methionyl-tRNA formyltransferase [Gemmatimonadota bacterium]
MAEERVGLKVLFWGTPDFGLSSLETMRAAGHEIVGVVTNPDRPAGRGRRLASSPVKTWALEAGVTVLQPERPIGEDFMSALRTLDPDVSVVAAYGQILREDVLALPRYGSINVHASALPVLRGAAPVNWAIIRGYAETGVSIMRMVLALDAGPVFAISRVPIDGETTAGGLYDTLANLGAAALVPVLGDLAAGRAVEVPQDDALATYAPKMDRETARIDWSLSAMDVSRWVRGCDPWPGGWTTLDGEPLQCFAPRVVVDDLGDPGVVPGTIVTAQQTLHIATGDGPIAIDEVRPAGKRRMASADWLRGRRELVGVRLV